LKYQLGIWPEIKREVEVDLPYGAQILHVNAQREKELCLWAIVETENPTEKRKFRIIGTGRPVKPKGLKYIGSVLLYMAEIVFHPARVTDG
jgi:hypothetical protein